MYLSRFNIWNSIDISTAVSIKNYEIQIFRFDFTHIHVYLCRVSFLTILDTYKIILRAVKDDDTTWCKVIIHLNCDRRQFALIHLFLEEAIAFVRQGFCNQVASWFSSCGWIEELCSQYPSQVGVLVMYLDPCIDWLVTYWKLCIEMRDFHYITSPIVYWAKGSTIGWYKVLGFLYL